MLESKGLGHYSFTPAEITKVIVTDANGDKNIDFVVHGIRDQQKLFGPDNKNPLPA